MELTKKRVSSKGEGKTMHSRYLQKEEADVQ